MTAGDHGRQPPTSASRVASRGGITHAVYGPQFSEIALFCSYPTFGSSPLRRMDMYTDNDNVIRIIGADPTSFPPSFFPILGVSLRVAADP